MSQETSNSISAELGIPLTDDLGKYLGIPTINGRVSRNTFHFILDRIDKKLTGWKAKVLSMAGRATLVQSLISSIPYYSMQTTRLPRPVCDDIDRKSRKFLWGGSKNQ